VLSFCSVCFWFVFCPTFSSMYRREWHCIAWLCWCAVKNLLTHSSDWLWIPPLKCPWLCWLGVKLYSNCLNIEVLHNHNLQECIASHLLLFALLSLVLIRLWHWKWWLCQLRCVMITADQWNLYIITDTSWYSRYSSTCGVHSSWSQVSAVHQDVMIHWAICRYTDYNDVTGGM